MTVTGNKCLPLIFCALGFFCLPTFASELFEEEDTLVVLGVLDDTPVDDAPQPLILQCGEASLTLAPDGSIRLEGGDFGLRVRDTVRITGAVIDLN